MVRAVLGPVVLGRGILALAPNGSMVVSESKSAPALCDIAAISAFLAEDQRFAAPPQTILALIDFGPQLLYRTPHRVIATPYHRNGNGIVDGRTMLATSDEAEARRLMSQRGVSLILLCPNGPERSYFSWGTSGVNFYEKLVSHELPPWISPVDLPDTLGRDFQVFKALP